MKEDPSPFQLPDTKCTKPGHAKYASHSLAGTGRISADWGPKCPVHCEEKDNDPWLAWATYREAYATTDGEDEEKAEAARELFMAKMLATVTLSNPPDAPFKMPMKKDTRVKTWYDIDGRPHEQEVERRILAIHWVLAAAFAAWLVLIAAGITLMGGW